MFCFSNCQNYKLKLGSLSRNYVTTFLTQILLVILLTEHKTIEHVPVSLNYMSLNSCKKLPLIRGVSPGPTRRCSESRSEEKASPFLARRDFFFFLIIDGRYKGIFTLPMLPTRVYFVFFTLLLLSRGSCGSLPAPHALLQIGFVYSSVHQLLMLCQEKTFRSSPSCLVTTGSYSQHRGEPEAHPTLPMKQRPSSSSSTS